ncbi:MAG: hypothetical protein ACYTBP_14570 [Planctomycetota bacterium]
MGETLFAFDILEIHHTNVRLMPYGQRLSHLESLGLSGSIVVVETAKTQNEKQQLYNAGNEKFKKMTQLFELT